MIIVRSILFYNYLFFFRNAIQAGDFKMNHTNYSVSLPRYTELDKGNGNQKFNWKNPWLNRRWKTKKPGPWPRFSLGTRRGGGWEERGCCTVTPLITNTSEEFIKCRLDNFSMSFILYYVNFTICDNKLIAMNMREQF